MAKFTYVFSSNSSYLIFKSNQIEPNLPIHLAGAPPSGQLTSYFTLLGQVILLSRGEILLVTCGTK